MLKSRRSSLDFIRVLAITLVIVAHTREFFFSMEGDPLILSLLRTAKTLGVPLFVLLTGYLMVDRPYESQTYLNKFLRRNFLPLLVAFEGWNLLWYLLGKIEPISYAGGGFPISSGRMVKAALFIGDTGTALWYLPMTIALYLGLPIVAGAIRHLNGMVGNGSSPYGKLLLMLLLISRVLSSRVITTFSPHEMAFYLLHQLGIRIASIGPLMTILVPLSGTRALKVVLAFMVTMGLVLTWEALTRQRRRG